MEHSEDEAKAGKVQRNCQKKDRDKSIEFHFYSAIKPRDADTIRYHHWNIIQFLFRDSVSFETLVHGVVQFIALATKCKDVGSLAMEIAEFTTTQWGRICFHLETRNQFYVPLTQCIECNADTPQITTVVSAFWLLSIDHLPEARALLSPGSSPSWKSTRCRPWGQACDLFRPDMASRL